MRSSTARFIFMRRNLTLKVVRTAGVAVSLSAFPRPIFQLTSELHTPLQIGMWLKMAIPLFGCATKDGKHFIMSVDERAWTFHPSGDDLAVCLISFDWQSMRFNFVPRSLLLDKETCTRFNFGSGDETFVIGRFINHEGKQQNLPTARFGCIAQMPIEPVDGQESFLVETRSIGGYSGSPVFVYIPVLTDRESVDDWNPPLTKPDPETGFRKLNEFWPPLYQRSGDILRAMVRGCLGSIGAISTIGNLCVMLAAMLLIEVVPLGIRKSA